MSASVTALILLVSESGRHDNFVSTVTIFFTIVVVVINTAYINHTDAVVTVVIASPASL